MSAHRGVTTYLGEEEDHEHVAPQLLDIVVHEGRGRKGPPEGDWGPGGVSGGQKTSWDVQLEFIYSGQGLMVSGKLQKQQMQHPQQMQADIVTHQLTAVGSMASDAAMGDFHTTAAAKTAQLSRTWGL